MQSDARELAAQVENEAAANEYAGLPHSAAFYREISATLIQQAEEIERLKNWIANPPRHEFWMPGDPDCPREIKTANGEIWKLLCKKCGIDRPGDKICRGEVE